MREKRASRVRSCILRTPNSQTNGVFDIVFLLLFSRRDWSLLQPRMTIPVYRIIHLLDWFSHTS